MEQQTLTGDTLRDPWDDEDLLREMYHDHGLTLREIADELGCDHTTVHRRMYEFGIERRRSERGRERDGFAAFHTRKDGYEYWSSKTCSVLVHRLVAVAEDGFEEVATGVVHHQNQISWDNRPGNIEILPSHRAHSKRHGRLNRHRRACEDERQQQFS